MTLYYLALLGFLLALAFAGGYLTTRNQGQPEETETAGEAGEKPARQAWTCCQIGKKRMAHGWYLEGYWMFLGGK